MKRLISVLLICSLLLSGCGKTNAAPEKTASDSNKLTVIATLFPQYDFAREIAGDKADITLLLPPGMESHSFEPTPGDIIGIQNADIFLYTGDEMEPWVSGIVENIEESPIVTDLSLGIALHKDEHEHEHEHDEEQEEEEHTEERDESYQTISHEGHSHAFDPHIWTSPINAMHMVESIEQAFIKADPANEDYYHQNAQAYLKKLETLHEKFQTIVAQGNQDTIYVGSRFSLLYFMEEYGLHYVAAYDSCEEEADPSIKRVVSMIDEMKEHNVKAVYYEELVEPYIAETIAEAADAEPLLFHSCHNLSKDELEAGETYLSLMEQNAINLEKGLQ